MSKQIQIEDLQKIIILQQKKKTSDDEKDTSSIYDKLRDLRSLFSNFSKYFFMSEDETQDFKNTALDQLNSLYSYGSLIRPTRLDTSQYAYYDQTSIYSL
jgi:hypothetical protein